MGTVPVMLWVTLGTAPVAHAVGLDGPEDADRRVSVSLGGGADRVSGYGHDTYPFLEVSAGGEAVVWKRLVLGAAFSAREDLNDYNDALGHWRGDRSTAVAAQVFLAYDGPTFHVAVGPWLYGAKRDRPNFRAAVLPYGVLRLRFGHQDRWHFNVHVADGVPFTAEGGALGLRLMMGAPARGRHRPSAGIYTSIGEKTLGLAFSDEIAGVGPRGTALRYGGLLGTDLEHPGSRPELTGFLGLVW
jgi:hypothetical protein